MRSLFHFRLLVYIAISACLLLTGCGPSAAASPAAQPVTLKLALIPVLDALPLYVAQQEGYFKEHGINVEFIHVSSPVERDQMVSTGQADGMINEAVSTMFYNKDGVQVQIVRYARAATADSPLFRILASKESGITTPQGLKGVEIGISQGTVIDYLTTRLLESVGLKAGEIKTVAVPNIPDRMSLLSSNKIKAAMLPDPTSTLAIQQGAVMVLDDTSHPEYSFSTIAFRKATIDQHPEAIRAFLAAIEQAVAKINSNPTGWSSLLTDQKMIPAPLVNTFKVPAFVKAGVPSQAQWADALQWAKDRSLVKVDVPYQNSVNASFLP